MSSRDQIRTTEIAPNVFQLTHFSPEANVQLNLFLARDDDPLLFGTGYRRTFSVFEEALSRLIAPQRLRYVAFSHFESDECGALNLWLHRAPTAQTICSHVGAVVNVNDFAVRPAMGLRDGDRIETGTRRFRFISTAQVPHGWDAGLLFEETHRTLFVSDLFFQNGNVEPVAGLNIVERSRIAMKSRQNSAMAGAYPYGHQTDAVMVRLGELDATTLAVMHGSSFHGDSRKAFADQAKVLCDLFGPNPAAV